MEWLPWIRGLVFGAALRVFARMPMGGAVHLAWQRSADVLQNELERPTQRGVRPAAGSQAIVFAVDAELRCNRSVDDQPDRRWIGRRLQRLQIEFAYGNRFG